jgi:adenosylcobinamide-GDP ribazoletransferase
MSDTSPNASNPEPGDTPSVEGGEAPDEGARKRPSFSAPNVDPAQWWAAILHALAAETRLHALPAEEATDERFLRSMRTLPLIGALVGAIGGLVFMVADVIDLTEIVSAALAVAAILIVTRPPHAEALATLIGGGSVEAEGAAIDIVRPAAVIALILIVVVELGVIAQVGAISAARVVLLLIASGAISRAVAVAALDWSAQQKPGVATDDPAKYRASLEAAAIALIIGLLCLFRDLDAFIAGTVAALIIGAATGLLGPPSAVSSLRRGYVVIQQSSEIGFLVVAAAAMTG